MCDLMVLSSDCCFFISDVCADIGNLKYSTSFQLQLQIDDSTAAEEATIVTVLVREGLAEIIVLTGRKISTAVF